MNPKTTASKENVQKIFEEVAPSGKLDLASFSNIVSGKRDFPDTKEEVIAAFEQMGDTAKTGLVDEKKMRSILMTFGTPLTSDEVTDLGSKAGINAAGKVEYKSWVERSYS